MEQHIQIFSKQSHDIAVVLIFARIDPRQFAFREVDHEFARRRQFDPVFSFIVIPGNFSRPCHRIFRIKFRIEEPAENNSKEQYYAGGELNFAAADFAFRKPLQILQFQFRSITSADSLSFFIVRLLFQAVCRCVIRGILIISTPLFRHDAFIGLQHKRKIFAQLDIHSWLNGAFRSRRQLFFTDKDLFRQRFKDQPVILKMQPGMLYPDIRTAGANRG